MGDVHNKLVSIQPNDRPLPELMQADELVIQADPATFHTIGCNLSSRVPVTYTDANGKTVKGFFTPEQKAGNTPLLDATRKDFLEKNPNLPEN